MAPLYLIILAFQAPKIATFHFKNNWLISAINFHDTRCSAYMYMYVCIQKQLVITLKFAISNGHSYLPSTVVPFIPKL